MATRITIPITAATITINLPSGTRAVSRPSGSCVGEYSNEHEPNGLEPVIVEKPGWFHATVVGTDQVFIRSRHWTALDGVVLIGLQCDASIDGHDLCVARRQTGLKQDHHDHSLCRGPQRN